MSFTEAVSVIGLERKSSSAKIQMSVSQALSETHLHSWNLLFRGKLYVSFSFLECDLGAGFEILCSQYHQDLAGYTKHGVDRAATGGCVEGRRVRGTGVNRWGRWDQEAGQKEWSMGWVWKGEGSHGTRLLGMGSCTKARATCLSRTAAMIPAEEQPSFYSLSYGESKHTGSSRPGITNLDLQQQSFPMP